MAGDETVTGVQYSYSTRSICISRGLASPATFPLSQGLAQRLRAITDQVYNGLGFSRLRGLNPRHYSEEERAIAYVGIASYVADQRSRNIDHIRDRTLANPNNDKLKPLELPVSMTFHTDVDVSDILSMFVQSVPLEGGEQYIASVASVYNDLMKTDPVVLATLAGDWHWERAFRPAANQELVRTYTRPLIGYQDNHLQVNFAATFIGGNPKYPLSLSAPPLTPQKLHALKAVQQAASKACIRLVPEPGDMLFINNYAMLHARSAWTDSFDDVWKQRYVMRLWLHDSQKGWKSATALKRKLDDNFDLPPEKQGLLTGTEWQELPRGLRVKAMVVSAVDCHD